MASLGEGFDVVPGPSAYILRRWVSGLPQDIKAFTFGRAPGARLSAFSALYEEYRRLRREADLDVREAWRRLEKR